MGIVKVRANHGGRLLRREDDDDDGDRDFLRTNSTRSERILGLAAVLLRQYEVHVKAGRPGLKACCSLPWTPPILPSEIRMVIVFPS